MQEQRTYGDDEVAEIFKAAAAAPATRRAGAPAPAPAAGFTLAELQSIGAEAGLAPDRVAEAAAALDLRRNALVRSDLGMPVSVGRVVDLPRAPTELEWEMILADLRQTFRARGRVGSRGDVREWTNGNLHAFVEPTPDGYRLRMGTTKGDAAGLNRMAMSSLVVALVWVLMFVVTGAIPASFFVPMILGLAGGGTLAWNALRLPGWAHTREAQMEEVGARAQAMLSRTPAPAPAADPQLSPG